jgi:hypothetical protein
LIGIEVLDIGRVSSGAVDVKLIKLHGSLDWFKLQDGKIVNLPSYKRKSGKQSIKAELILYPLHQKDLYLDPWFDLFKAFKHDLSKAVLSFQLRNGFKFIKVLPDYLYDRRGQLG